VLGKLANNIVCKQLHIPKQQWVPCWSNLKLVEALRHVTAATAWSYCVNICCGVGKDLC